MASPSLTVLAFNTWHRNNDLERLETYLAGSGADVVVLSEFGLAKRPLLTRLRHVYPYQVECASEQPCALALLSRVPFEASGPARIDAGKPAFVWARLGGSVTLIGTHLHRPSRNPWLHRQQVDALAKFIRRIDGPVILAGDLNTSPWSNAYRVLRNETGLAPTTVLLPTWPAWPIAAPQVALDHIFASPELTPTAAGSGPAIGSDHLPVWTQFERKPSFERYRPMVRRLASSAAALGPHLGRELLADLGSEHRGARDLSR